LIVANTHQSQGEALFAMVLGARDVERVAELAQLALSPEEQDLFREQLSSILGHFERLQQLDTGAIPPTATILPLENAMRDDQVQPSLPLADVLANAPAVQDGCFRVPVVLERDG
jgi:aspartyl-tRNA(Asn)/glutamyl-tRNA(Gln) amidotransferase subunit C